MIPKKVNISINFSIPITKLYSNQRLDYFDREDFKDTQIMNIIENDVRDLFWKGENIIPDNKIKISFE